MLRPAVQKIIAQSPNPEQAAFDILKLLDEQIGLSGNGWFDDDPEMEAFLSEA